LAGKGQFADDVRLPRMLHAAVLRSPHAHARIVRLDVSAARAAKGVARVLTGADIAGMCKPYVGVLKHIKTMQSAPQLPLAVDVARWQGEPVAFVVAETRAIAEDAMQKIAVEYEELPAVTNIETALDAATPLIHPQLGSNLCFERKFDTGNVDEVFAQAHQIVEATFTTGRHSPVTLEPRTIVADFNAPEGMLTVWHSTQVPYMMQWIIAHHYGLAENNVRVIAPDVGGAFGMKIHTYGDDMAACAAALATGRPVKFVADRLESFVSDFHARGHRARVRVALSKAGDMLGFEVDDVYGIGPFSGYPRGGANEGIHVTNLTGAPYKPVAYRGHARAVFQNKGMYGQYRAVGHPVVCAVTEGIVDIAADAVGMDPAEFRRRNLAPDHGYPRSYFSGATFEKLSQQESLELLLKTMSYDTLRTEQAALREQGVYRGIGLAMFIENSMSSSATYGQGGASIASQDACTIRLMPTGGITVATSLTEFGQGAHAVAAQVAATTVGVPIDSVRVIMGDTETTPYGGGNWGSRGTGIGGEAVFQTGKALKANILNFVARLTESEASMLDVRDGHVVDAATGAVKISLEEVARTAYFRTEQVPKDYQPELTVTRSYAQKHYSGIFTNGAHASYVEVDPQTGFVKLLKHWVIDDAGTVVNPLLVDEQIRGGVVQGIGAALFEQCLYSDEGQLLNGSLADYLVPMAGEMPDIVVGHTHSPTKVSELGARGAGEAGVAGAPAAVMNAINDALKPFNARVYDQPFTPERILRALGRVA
jgi:carbon-monoxide dehydrogenase large subunit